MQGNSKCHPLDSGASQALCLLGLAHWPLDNKRLQFTRQLPQAPQCTNSSSLFNASAYICPQGFHFSRYPSFTQVAAQISPSSFPQQLELSCKMQTQSPTPGKPFPLCTGIHSLGPTQGLYCPFSPRCPTCCLPLLESSLSPPHLAGSEHPVSPGSETISTESPTKAWGKSTQKAAKPSPRHGSHRTGM